VLLGLTLLRYVPLGMLVPLFVLYPTAAGLSLTQVGALFATLTACVVLCELPTGGLADAWGRRRTLILAAATGTVALGLMLAADSMPLFVLAFAVNGVFWALDSGPLEAWYVDTVLAIEPERELSGDLSLAHATISGAIAAGSLAVAGIVELPLGSSGLTAAVAVAFGLQILYLLGVALLVRETPHQHRRHGRASIGGTVTGAVRSGWRKPLRYVLAVQVSWGAGISVVELLWQPVTQRAAGTGRPWVFGVMAAAAWLVAALSTALLPRLIRLVGGRVNRAAAVLRVAQGVALVPLAIGGGLAPVVAGYVLVYFVNGPSNAAQATLLHRYAEGPQRATVLSLDSFVQRICGGLASVSAGALATAAGAPVVLGLAAAVLAAGAPCYLWRREPAPPARDDAGDTGESNGAAPVVAAESAPG
jgi:MFS transporter, DHA1 family, tetracycline resistance protein